MNIVCFRCGMPGHIAPRCTMPTMMGMPSPKYASGGGGAPHSNSAYVVGKTVLPQYRLGVPNNGKINKGVYVLEMANGTFYVGKSVNIAERIAMHRSGQGAACVVGKFKRVDPETPSSHDMEGWERAETLARMLRYGIHGVRGWQYTTVALSSSQVEHAFQQICEKFDLCRQCGRAGHFVQQCNADCRAPWYYMQMSAGMSFAPPSDRGSMPPRITRQRLAAMEPAKKKKAAKTLPAKKPQKLNSVRRKQAVPKTKKKKEATAAMSQDAGGSLAVAAT